MQSTRWYPLGNVFAEADRLSDEINQLFGRRRGARSMGGGFPPMNVWEDEDKLMVEAELPGLRIDDLEIFVHEGNQLSMKGERKRPEVENGTWHRRERGYGQFERVIELPFPVDADSVTARFSHGVLTIELPKREDVKPRRIEVNGDA